MFLMYMLVGLMAIFKSYPSYGDVALYLALLPLWRFTFSCKLFELIKIFYPQTSFRCLNHHIPWVKF